MKFCLTVFLILCSICGYAVNSIRIPEPDTQILQQLKVQNFHRVSAGIYRSAQPPEHDFKILEKSGFKSILNLRHWHSDEDAVESTGLSLFHIRLSSSSVTDSELLLALQTVKSAPKPLLIHCRHGSDRTGVVCAGVQIVFSGMSVDSAVSEMKKSEFGHHSFIFPNLERLLREAKWDMMRCSLNKAPVQK